MFNRLRNRLSELRSDTSGNAVMLVAIGIPSLIGASAFAVDTSQWYMWQRELQFAVDQAALAGAYAKASNTASVRSTYSTRAVQEYNANLNIVGGFDGTPSVSLASYGTGTNNSVVVSSTATKELPFTGYLIGHSTTVSASAQATFSAPANFSTCMLAVDPTASQAFKFGGSVSGSSECGAGALSNATGANGAMKELGNNSVPLGMEVSAGDIDSTFSNNGTIYANQSGLSDPYASLTTPSSAGQPSYTYPASCPAATPASHTYTADGSTRTHTTYKYYKGSNSNNWTLQTSYTGTGYIADGWSPAAWPGVAFTDKSVTSTATTGVQTETTPVVGSAVNVTGTGNNRIWRVPSTSTQDNFTNITSTAIPANDGKVYLQPGIYSAGITINCTTVFAPGIYFIGGDLDFGQNQTVTGTGGVMFYMTSSSGSIHINSNSDVTLSGIDAATLTSDYGYSSADADTLAGMLYWDKDSTSAFTMNGNSNLHLSGIMYMPKRDATFNGNSTADGNCLMVAAKTLKIDGNFSLNNFCVTTGSSAISIGGSTAQVKLVS